MKIFLTGTNSFIGTELLGLCQGRGIDSSGVDQVESAFPDCHVGDIRDPSIADLIPENADAVIHLVALHRNSDCRNRAQEVFDVNVMGTLNVIAAAEKRKSKQFVFASSEWVYDALAPDVEVTEDHPIDPLNLTSEYALSKLVSETNLKQKFLYGFCPVTILRFGIAYGSRLHNWSAVESLFNTVATSDEVEVGSLATARRFIHVSDVADAVVRVIGSTGFEIINIEGPSLVALGEIIDKSAKILNRSPKVVETDRKTPDIRNVSSAKAESLLGWQAKVDLSEGLARLNEFLNAAAK